MCSYGPNKTIAHAAGGGGGGWKGLNKGSSAIHKSNKSKI